MLYPSDKSEQQSPIIVFRLDFRLPHIVIGTKIDNAVAYYYYVRK